MSSTRPEAGDTIPDFRCPASSGADVTQSDLRGGRTVLFFYPKDDTPGCTKEAIAFSELKQQFLDAGCNVLGASKDKIAKHEKFIAKHDLSVALLSDAEGDLCEAFGVWVQKKMYGREYMGIERTTFFIDANLQILQIWRKVRVAGHADTVLAAVKDAPDTIPD